jgi:hypothetical protein
MTSRSIAAGILALSIVGCAASTPTIPTSSTTAATVAGQYTLIGVDTTRNLPCCGQADSSGAIVTTGGGLLQIGWNVPSGRYEWDAVRSHGASNGTSQMVQSLFSAGSYTWDGQTLTLADSTGLGTMTGTRVTGRLTINALGHQFRFLELVEMPH